MIDVPDSFVLQKASSAHQKASSAQTIEDRWFAVAARRGYLFFVTRQKTYAVCRIPEFRTANQNHRKFLFLSSGPANSEFHFIVFQFGLLRMYSLKVPNSAAPILIERPFFDVPSGCHYLEKGGETISR